MRAANALASLHICTGSIEPSLLDNTITVPKSLAGDFCDIYASSEDSGESTYLCMLA